MASSLPSELLCAIFAAAEPLKSVWEDGTWRPGSKTVLTFEERLRAELVCKHWRAVLSNEPGCFTFLSIDGPRLLAFGSASNSEADKAARLEKAMARTRALTARAPTVIHLRMQLEMKLPHELLGAYTNALTALLSRPEGGRSFTLTPDAPFQDGADAVLAAVAPHASCRHLELHCHDLAGQPVWLDPTPRLSCLPHVRTMLVELGEGTVASISLPMPSLEELTLPEMVEDLGPLPSRGVDLSAPDSNNGAVPFPALRRLSLSTMAFVLSAAGVPALEQLRLTLYSPEEEHEVDVYLPASDSQPPFPSLNLLDLDASTIYTPTVVEECHFNGVDTFVYSNRLAPLLAAAAASVRQLRLTIAEPLNEQMEDALSSAAGLTSLQLRFTSSDGDWAAQDSTRLDCRLLGGMAQLRQLRTDAGNRLDSPAALAALPLADLTLEGPAALPAIAAHTPGLSRLELTGCSAEALHSAEAAVGQALGRLTALRCLALCGREELSTRRSTETVAKAHEMEERHTAAVAALRALLPAGCEVQAAPPSVSLWGEGMEVSEAGGSSSMQLGSGGGSTCDGGGSGGGGSSWGGTGFAPVTFALQPEAPFQYVWAYRDLLVLQLLAAGQHLLLLRILPAHAHGLEAAGQAHDVGDLIDEYTSHALQFIKKWSAEFFAYIDCSLASGDEDQQPLVTALYCFKQELLEARAGVGGVSAPEQLLQAVLSSRHFPAVLQDIVATATSSIPERVMRIESALDRAALDTRILQPCFAGMLHSCMNRTTLLLRVLEAAERHNTLADRQLFSFGGKTPIESCSMLASHIAMALAPACCALSSHANTWLSSPHLSPRARQRVSACVSRFALRIVNQVTAAASVLTAYCTLQGLSSTSGSSSSTPASATTARLKKRLGERQVLADSNGAGSHSSSAVSGTEADALSADCAAAALLEQEQREQQAQQERAAAKAAKRQRHKQRKAAEAAEAAAAAAAVSAEQDSAAELQAVPVAPALPACPSDTAAAGGEPAQPSASSPEPAVQPAASGLDQLELLLAQLGVGTADPAGEEEGQEADTGAGGGACLLPSTAAVAQGQPSANGTCTSSAEQSIDSLLVQLGVGGRAVGSRPCSGSSWAAPTAPSSAAAAALASTAGQAEDDSLDALLAQLGVGSCGAGAAAGAATTAPHPTATTPAGLDAALLASLECPLTLQTMRQPVVAADGNTYEQEAIAAWVARQQAAGQAPRSPLTNQPLGDLSLRPNRTLASLIAGLRASGQL